MTSDPKAAAPSRWMEDLVRIAEGKERRKRGPVVNHLSPLLHELNFWKGQRYGFIVFTKPSEREGYWWGKCMRCKKTEREYRLDRRNTLSTCGCLRTAMAKQLHKHRKSYKRKKKQ